MIRYSILLCLALLMLINTPLYSGAKVSVRLKDGNQINGELLVVTDSSFIISRIENLHEEKLKIARDQIVLIRRDYVESFIVCGRSHLINGVVLGFTAGICIGSLMAYEPRGVTEWGSNYDSYGSGFKTIALFAAGGMSLGALVGATSSTSDKILSKREFADREFLVKMARYGDNEPEFIKKANLKYP